MNINRDFLIILDVKSGEVDSPNIYYFNTDKNTSNLYVQMVMRETTVDVNPIENAIEYSIKANILKPNMVGKEVEGTLVNPEKAIYEFKLPADCTDFSGNAKIEFEVYTGNKIATSFATKFKVHGSVLTEQNKYIEDSSDYPILKELMAEVKVINETAHELDTVIRTLQADMIEANNEMKTNEATRQANEATRVANEATRVEAERNRANQETARVEVEASRETNEQRRIAKEDERKVAENQRKANEFERRTNENERKSAEASRVSAENTRVANEEIRQTNEANREVAEEIRKANEQARIAEHEAMRTEHEQTMAAVNEVKAENVTLMENDKKQADRMTQVEISDKRQYVIMEGLMNSAGDGYLKIEDTGNDTTLYNSVEGFVDVKNITGNTMVNSIKNPDDELTLNGDINTSGQSVTLTTVVDNGQVDVLAEGNTMVNVCDQQEAVAITKSYTVETGNHIALQGEYDGKARPVVTGNTLVNIVGSEGEQNHIDKNSRMRDLEILQPLKLGVTYTSLVNISNLELGTLNSLLLNADTYYNDSETYDNSAGINFGTISSNGLVKALITPSDNITKLVLKLNLSDMNNGGSFTTDNIMLLEGDYTNKPVPDYFTGMQSSFEDNVVTQEMVDSGKELAENLGKYRVDYKVTGKNKANNFVTGYISSSGSFLSGAHNCRTDFIPIQPNTTYTASISSIDDTTWVLNKNYSWFDKDKNFITRITTNNTSCISPSNARYLIFHNATVNDSVYDINNVNLQLEEGDTATAYEPYKESIKTYYLNSPLLEGDTIEESGGNVYHVHRYGKVVLDGSKTYAIAINSNDANGIPYFTIPLSNAIGALMCDKLIGRKDTSEDKIAPSTTNLGIMLDGNKLLRIKTGATTLDEFNTWISNNPLTVIYELASPTRELISQSDTILTDSYVAGHLDFDTAVPVEKVVFKDTGALFLKYLYTSTDYTIQFESDNIGKLTTLFFGITQRDGWDIVKGINKINVSTPSTLSNNYLSFSGIGFSASNIVVTEATDKDFGYFAGMKSVGELEENTIEIVSANGTDSTAEGYLSNSKQILLNEPLRAVGDTKDRFVQIDGKWYVERNVYQLIADGSPDESWSLNGASDSRTYGSTFRLKNIPHSIEVIGSAIATNIKCDKLRNLSPRNAYGRNDDGSEVEANTIGIATGTAVGDGIDVRIPKSICEQDSTKFKLWLSNNPLTIAYILNQPTYEPVEIAPELNTYTDVTHITNNSTIPMNMPIVNSGYELIAKPSTKYTVVGIDNGRIGDSTIVNGTITTPATLDDPFLRPYGTGKTSKVMLLEGEPANIPGYFKGMKSVFEDKVTEDGKYAVEVKVIGKNKFDKNTMTCGMVTGNIGSKASYVEGSSNHRTIKKIPCKYGDVFTLTLGEGNHDRNVVIQLDENEIILANNTLSTSVTKYEITHPHCKYLCIYLNQGNNPISYDNIQLEEGTVASEYEPYHETKQTLYLDEPLYNTNNITIYNDELGYWKNYDIRDYQDGDFGTYLTDMTKTVYQLAEPVFVPLIDNCPNFVIGSWDNCSIHFDSIIPLKDTRYRYTGNVPSVVTMSNDVAEAKSVSDQQDSMIIDLATDVAVMEMMLM